MQEDSRPSDLTTLVHGIHIIQEELGDKYSADIKIVDLKYHRGITCFNMYTILYDKDVGLQSDGSTIWDLYEGIPSGTDIDTYDLALLEYEVWATNVLYAIIDNITNQLANELCDTVAKLVSKESGNATPE